MLRHEPGPGQPWAIKPGGGKGVQGGNSEFDAALAQVLQAIGELHTQIAAEITVGTTAQVIDRGAHRITPQAASPLTPFAGDWVGSDIDGLQALAATLFGYLAEISATVTTLNRQAAQLIGQTASIVDGLAVDLAMIESALEDEAYAASRYGVTIGTDGRPPPVPAGRTADARAASVQHWAQAYQQVYEQAMAAAQQARQHAATQLTAVHAGPRPGILTDVLSATGAVSHPARPTVVRGG